MERGSFLMSEQFNSSVLENVSTHVLSTKKYKTNHIAFYIRQPLEEEHYTKVALIPSVLKRGTLNKPTAQKIRQVLDDLYGASLHVDVMKRGEEQIVVFRLQIANEKFLKDQTPLFEQGVELLSKVITQPVLEDGVFTKKYVELEKDLLQRKLTQIKDDKVRYANKRCVEEMFKTERFRLFANGSLDQLEQITAGNLYAYYQQMIQKHPINLFVVGDVQEENVQQALKKHLQLNRSDVITIPKTEVTHHVQKKQEVIENTKIAQGKLHIGCRTNTGYADKDYIPLIVYNGIFGGFSHSKLFRHVREKESLAYYVNSSVESHMGLMMIMSGIDYKNYQKTVEIIKEQLTQMRQGEISEEEMSQTKAVLINQIKESTDQAFQTIDRFYHGVIGGVHRKTEEVIEAIQKVTIEEVRKVAQKIEMDTIYFLTEEDKKEA